MELDRSDMKRRTVSSSILEEDSISPPLVKRTKVQAQRKFAQGSTTIQVAPTTSTGQFTSYNERYKKAPPVQRKFNPDDYDINEITHPKTEDFITFLCFRDTEFLPPRLNFFNVPQQYINKVTKNKPDQNFTEKIPAKKTTVKGDQKTTVKGDQKKKVPPKGNKKGKAGRPTAMVTQTTSVGKNVTKKRLSNNNASNNRSAVETRLRPKTTSKRSKDVKASTSLKKYKSESEDDIFSSDTCSSDTESDSSISNQIRRNPSRNVKHNMKNEFTRITRSNKGRSDDIEVEDSRRTGSLPNKKVNQKNTSTSLRNKQNAASGPKSGNPLGCFNENDDAQVLKNTRRNSKKSSVSISEGTAVCLLNKLQVPTTDTIRIDSNFSSNMEKSGNRKVPKISKETIDRQQIMGENEHDSPRKLRSESERICKKIRENELLSQRNEKPKLINKNELNEIDSTKSVEKMELKDNCSSKLVKNLKKSNTVKKDKLSVSTSCNVILKKQGMNAEEIVVTIQKQGKGCSSTKSDDNHKSVIGLTQESKTSLMENNDKDDEMEKLVEVKKHLAPSEAMSESCRKNSTHTDRKKSSKACRKSGTCGNASRQQFESLNPRSVKGRVSVSSQPSASSEVNINKVDSQSKSSDYPELGKTPDNAVSNANELAKKIAIIARDEIVKNANIGNRRDSSSDSNKSQVFNEAECSSIKNDNNLKVINENVEHKLTVVNQVETPDKSVVEAINNLETISSCSPSPSKISIHSPDADVCDADVEIISLSDTESDFMCLDDDEEPCQEILILPTNMSSLTTTTQVMDNTILSATQINQSRNINVDCNNYVNNFVKNDTCNRIQTFVTPTSNNIVTSEGVIIYDQFNANNNIQLRNTLSTGNIASHYSTIVDNISSMNNTFSIQSNTSLPTIPMYHNQATMNTPILQASPGYILCAKTSSSGQIYHVPEPYMPTLSTPTETIVAAALNNNSQCTPQLVAPIQTSFCFDQGAVASNVPQPQIVPLNGNVYMGTIMPTMLNNTLNNIQTSGNTIIQNNVPTCPLVYQPTFNNMTENKEETKVPINTIICNNNTYLMVSPPSIVPEPNFQIIATEQGLITKPLLRETISCNISNQLIIPTQIQTNTTSMLFVPNAQSLTSYIPQPNIPDGSCVAEINNTPLPPPTAILPTEGNMMVPCTQNDKVDNNTTTNPLPTETNNVCEDYFAENDIDRINEDLKEAFTENGIKNLLNNVDDGRYKFCINEKVGNAIINPLLVSKADEIIPDISVSPIVDEITHASDTTDILKSIQINNFELTDVYNTNSTDDVDSSNSHGGNDTSTTNSPQLTSLPKEAVLPIENDTMKRNSNCEVEQDANHKISTISSKESSRQFSIEGEGEAKGSEISNEVKIKRLKSIENNVTSKVESVKAKTTISLPEAKSYLQFKINAKLSQNSEKQEKKFNSPIDVYDFDASSPTSSDFGIDDNNDGELSQTIAESNVSNTSITVHKSFKNKSAFDEESSKILDPSHNGTLNTIEKYCHDSQQLKNNKNSTNLSQENVHKRRSIYSYQKTKLKPTPSNSDNTTPIFSHFECSSETSEKNSSSSSYLQLQTTTMMKFDETSSGKSQVIEQTKKISSKPKFVNSVINSSERDIIMKSKNNKQTQRKIEKSSTLKDEKIKERSNLLDVMTDVDVTNQNDNNNSRTAEKNTEFNSQSTLIPTIDKYDKNTRVESYLKLIPSISRLKSNSLIQIEDSKISSINDLNQINDSNKNNSVSANIDKSSSSKSYLLNQNNTPDITADVYKKVMTIKVLDSSKASNKKNQKTSHMTSSIFKKPNEDLVENEVPINLMDKLQVTKMSDRKNESIKNVEKSTEINTHLKSYLLTDKSCQNISPSFNEQLKVSPSQKLQKVNSEEINISEGLTINEEPPPSLSSHSSSRLKKKIDKKNGSSNSNKKMLSKKSNQTPNKKPSSRNPFILTPANFISDIKKYQTTNSTSVISVPSSIHNSISTLTDTSASHVSALSNISKINHCKSIEETVSSVTNASICTTASESSSTASDTNRTTSFFIEEMQSLQSAQTKKKKTRKKSVHKSGGRRLSFHKSYLSANQIDPTGTSGLSHSSLLKRASLKHRSKHSHASEKSSKSKNNRNSVEDCILSTSMAKLTLYTANVTSMEIMDNSSSSSLPNYNTEQNSIIEIPCTTSLFSEKKEQCNSLSTVKYNNRKNDQPLKKLCTESKLTKGTCNSDLITVKDVYQANIKNIENTKVTNDLGEAGNSNIYQFDDNSPAISEPRNITANIKMKNSSKTDSFSAISVSSSAIESSKNLKRKSSFVKDNQKINENKDKDKESVRFPIKIPSSKEGNDKKSLSNNKKMNQKIVSKHTIISKNRRNNKSRLLQSSRTEVELEKLIPSSGVSKITNVPNIRITLDTIPVTSTITKCETLTLTTNAENGITSTICNLQFQGSVCYTEKSSTLMETTESTKTKGVSSGNKTIASSNSAATSSKNVAGNSGRHLSFYKSYLSAYGEKNVKPQQAKSEISKPTNMSRDKHPKCYSKKINLPPLNETESTKNDTSASSVKRLWLNKEKHFDAFTQTDSLTTNSVKYTFTDNVKASTSENSYLKPKNIKEREHLRKSTIGETSDKSSALQLLERKDEELSNINDDDKTKKVENNSRDVTDTDYDGSQDNVKSNDSGARTSVNGNTTKIDEKSKTSKEFEHNGELLEAPTFYPTEEEFQDPMEYINNVCSVAERYGLCRIVPPSTFKPECKVTDEMRFMAYNQYVHKMLNRWGPNVKEVMAIKKYLATQSVTFTHSPWIGGVEVDLSRLYQTVQQCGGLKEVMEEEKWHNVADLLKIPKLAKDGITKLDDIYCKYLLPYDTLSPNERKKLFEQVEKEWKIHDKYECVDDNCIFDDAEECIAKGRTMPLSCFYRIARNTMMMWLDDDSSTEQVEGEFWKHVSSRNCHVCVNSGSIDSGPNGYGFPVNKTSTLAKHPWNLKILTNNSSSILRYLGPIIGVTVPTLHMGMLYSACCWYRDPHGLPWIEYLHTGASKIWYGIPDEYSAEFKNAIGTLAPRYCRDKKIWLSSDTVMIPPAMLVEKNVYLSRVVQHPGQFIVVFPKSFTSNISTGYLVSESVYFAHPSWLDTAAEVFNDMQESCEPPVFSLEQLLINISNDLRCDLKVLVKILPMLNNVKNNEIKYRNKLVQIGLSVKRNATCNKRSRQKSTQDNNEMQECESCGVCLFISSVVNSTEQTNYCLKDGLEYLTENRNDIENCKLMYTYAEDELENLIVKVQERIQVKSNKSRACK